MAKPERPEPKFFLSSAACELGRAEYERRHFHEEPEAWLRGEKSTSYIESEAAIRRIMAMFPTAKVLVVLREPVARTLSNYHFSVQNGFETRELAEALWGAEGREAEDYRGPEVSVSPYAYLARSKYIDYIQMLDQHVTRAQRRVALFEQLVGGNELEEIYRFLGVDSSFRPQGLDAAVNSTGGSAPEVSPKELDRLSDHFVDANDRLAQYLGHSLTPWGR
jgi:hypothetical protein